jgi:pimeloyl-ACP methyl ester carboxylesterase
MIGVRVVALGIAVVGLASCSLVYPAPTSAPPPPPDAELVRTTARDGVAVRALVLGHGSGTLLVHFHGNGVIAEDRIALARQFVGVGIDVMLVEYRGYGASAGAGKPSEAGLYADAEAALAAAPAHARVVIWGWSLGSGVATEMAARGHGDALVLEAPFTALRDVPALVFPRALVDAFVPDRYDNVAKAPQVKQPVLVLHGTDDRLVPFVMGEHLAKVFPNAELVPIARAGHGDVWTSGAAYVAMIRVCRGE